MPAGDSFGRRTAEWAAWQSSPWGLLRDEVVPETTQRALTGGVLR